MKFIRLLCITLMGFNTTNITLCSATPRLQSKESIKNFSQWCKQKLTLPSHTKHTIEVLLQKIGTTNCANAEQELNNLTYLNLGGNQISDMQFKVY